MRKEDIVVSLELAKRLKEVGVRQESMLFWVRWKDKDKWSIRCPDEYMREEWKFSPLVECYSAYTATELMEKLPERIRVSERQHFYLVVYKLSNSYKVNYDHTFFDTIETLCEFEDRKLSDALAQALIWWREKGNE